VLEHRDAVADGSGAASMAPLVAMIVVNRALLVAS
jgi:hypothetical protein